MKQEIEKYWYSEGHLNENQRDFLIELLTELKPKYCIETGFATGRSCVTTLISARPEKLISIDIDFDYMKARDYIFNLMNNFSNLQVIESDTNKLFTDEFFQMNFPDGIDYAFLDGDHSYIGLMNDLKWIYKNLNSSGIIVVDDYYSYGPEGCELVEVNQAIDEFCFMNSIKVEKWNSNGKGFAIIKK